MSQQLTQDELSRQSFVAAQEVRQYWRRVQLIRLSQCTAALLLSL